MASTSLQEQLQKLAAPQTAIYKDDKKRASLLFNPKEAASKDRDTFYEIGLSGLKELITLHEGFSVYMDTLFSLTSKDFERAVQSKDVNKKLDQTIEQFLLQISPYFLLQSSHKALEWLVNRYSIHQYNQDAIITLIIPYHETKIFVRFIQILEIKSSRWSWLQPLQKHGVPLSKQVLHNQCVSNTATLQFISKMVVKYVKKFGERASQLNTVFAFFCSTVIGTISTSKNVTEAILSAILPAVLKGLDSPVEDFRSATYVTLGYLTTKATIQAKTLNEILIKLLTSEYAVTYDAMLLINLIYTNQKHLTKIPEEVLKSISPDTMSSFCINLKKMVELKISIQAFVTAFLISVLPLLQRESEEFKLFCKLPELLIDEIDLRNQQPEKIISCVLNSYKGTKPKSTNDESDIEIIDDEENTSDGILKWYSMFLKKFEHSYPDAFDKVIKKEMSSSSNITAKRRTQLSLVLGFNPAVAHKIKGKYLFENLNHVNPENRIQAVNYIAKEFDSLKIENQEFLKESILNRLLDDNQKVVTNALEIPSQSLEEILNESDLTSIFSHIMAKDANKWGAVMTKAIEYFCSINQLPVNHDVILAIMPHLFASDKKSAELTLNIVSSTWGKKAGLKALVKKIDKSVRNNHLELNKIMFKAMFDEKILNFEGKLDADCLKRENTLDILLFILVKSSNIDNGSINSSRELLSILLSCIANKTVIGSVIHSEFCSENFLEFIELAKMDQILFEVMEYVFANIIEQLSDKSVEKSWCNVLSTTESKLVRELYEIFITGCTIEVYSKNYANLMQKLLNKLFKKPNEKFEYICSMAVGHLLYSTEKKDLINPELQLRSLKLIVNFVGAQKDAKWIYDSDVLIATILINLNRPISTIRECTIQLIKTIIHNDPDKNSIYVQLYKELIAHEQELIMDHEQILQTLKTILTQQAIGNKMFRKKCLQKLTGMLLGDTPPHIKAALVMILSSISNSNSFSDIIQSLNALENILKNNASDMKLVLDIYQSNLIKNVYSLINVQTVTAISVDHVWKSIDFGLKEYRECILNEDQTFSSPCMLIMKKLSENVLEKVPTEKMKDLVNLITSAGTYSNNPAIASTASKVMKRINLHFADFKPILEGMLNVKDPASNVPKRKNVTISMLSYQLVETDEWRLGVTLLEYIQSKEKMSIDGNFVSLLFQLLNKCLRFEEQSFVEYTKQLILSSLWYYCKENVDETDKDQIKSIKNIFNVEIVVQCIRGTQNPQTQHHALILLSHAAYMLPEQVLHHTMEIFTFMGSSVLRHDDAYSFQIIIKIIETLIPILVKLDRDINDYSEKELQQLQKRVVPVLRIFADVVLHVPEHRRLPLYKKLIDTLGANRFLWVFIGLLLETHVAHANENKKKDKRSTRALADQESPINGLDFGQSILLEFSPVICLETLIKLFEYMKTLPLQKDDDSMDTDVDASDIFSVNGHTSVQLRHYKYVLVTFMSSFLSSPRFIQHSSQTTDVTTMETHYKSFIVHTLTFIHTISKVTDEKTAKYWRVMLHHSYDLLDNTNNLLSPPMFVSVIRGLLSYTVHTVRRKSMELLNSKIQYSPEMFSEVDNQVLFSLLPPLLDIVKTIDNTEENENELVRQEIESNQQAALLSLKLLTRMLASIDPEPFKSVLETVTNYTCNLNLSGNVIASLVLCLAELCSNLKAHALSSLRKFMPALIKVLKKQRQADTPELILLSTVTAISKIVESLPLFLSPYLQKILYEYSILLSKWLNYDQECSKISAIVSKLTNIRKKIAGSIPPRVLIPVANETHKLILEKENFDAVGPLMSVLAESFTNVTTADFSALQQDLTAFFLSALQLRSDAIDKNIDAAVIGRAEDEVVNALVNLVLKLSETSFRPFYFKIYDWAIRTNIEGHKDRTITFYRLSSAIADKLKGLFVLFAGHFIKNAAELLDACNNSKTEDLYFDSEEKCILLIEAIIKTLHIVCLYDSQSFLNKDRFDTMMQPIVDQLENTLGGITCLKTRAKESIIPCISQFAVAVADDSLWKLLNYQVLLKTRHNDSEIRLTALECLVSMASQLGSNWLPLLAESVPFLAELLEDGDPKIESATKDAVRTLEQILGEPLEKYF